MHTTRSMENKIELALSSLKLARKDIERTIENFSKPDDNSKILNLRTFEEALQLSTSLSDKIKMTGIDSVVNNLEPLTVFSCLTD